MVCHSTHCCCGKREREWPVSRRCDYTKHAKVIISNLPALRVLTAGTAVRSATWPTRADKVSINLTVQIGVAKVTTVAIIVVLTVARLRLHGDTTEELRYLQSRGGVGSYAEDGKEECDLHGDDFSW